MLSSILPYMHCPFCTGTELRTDSDGLNCAGCGAHFPLRQGVLDMLGESREEVITPFQRVMQTPLIVNIYEKFWRRAGYYLASSRSFSREVDTVKRHERGRDCARLLDLACGPGVFTRPLARQGGGIVVGFDLSWPMLQQARKLVEREGLRNVVLIRGTAFHLPFVASTFDYVNCCGALHLFDQPEVALGEIDRVLRREGHFCVQTTIRPNHSGGFAFLLERFIRFGFFGESELLEMIRSKGFVILESERHRISYTFLARHN